MHRIKKSCRSEQLSHSANVTDFTPANIRETGTLDAMTKNQTPLLAEWKNGLEASGAARNLKEQDLRQQTSEFLQLIVSGLERGNGQNGCRSCS